MSATDVAERFEVSTRTIERDVSALRSGALTWSQQRPGGGHRPTAF